MVGTVRQRSSGSAVMPAASRAFWSAVEVTLCPTSSIAWATVSGAVPTAARKPTEARNAPAVIMDLRTSLVKDQAKSMTAARRMNMMNH